MAVFSAGVRVGATVPPGKALELPADGQGPGVGIDMPPLEPKRLALAQPQGQGDAPAGAGPLGRSQPEDPQCFIESQRLDSVMTGRRRISMNQIISSFGVPVLARHGPARS